jgi:Fic family protein
MAADERRHDDVDGRGALSEAALTEFCDFFLKVCVDQVEFMENILDAGRLLGRIEAWLAEQVAAGTLHPKSLPLVREAFQKGALDRGQAADLTGLGERQARAVLSKLIERGVLASPGHRDPVRLVFPSELAERWFPSLYPRLN